MSEQFLEQEAQEELVRLTRLTIEAAVRHESGPHAGRLAGLRASRPALARPAGAFVTIYVAGQLRGCLGEIEAEDPLLDVAVRCAHRAPLYDYRFTPVAPDELKRLTFKISVLGPPRPLAKVEEIEIGVHGLVARYLSHVGLLLPDVPVEYGWDKRTFIEHLWRKAGIDPAVPVGAVKLEAFTSQLIQSADFPQVAAGTVRK